MGPIAKIEGNKLFIWVYNRKDDGTVPKKPEELPEPTVPYQIQFRFPNIWQNRISDKVKIIIAFVPIDETTTKLYIRFYQNFIKIPIIRGIFHFFGSITNKRIERQDKQVVETQDPIKSDIKMDEKLIQGDRPIILYRKHRQMLKEGRR